MIYFLSKTLDVLLSPLAWALILLGSSFFGGWFRLHRGWLVAASMAVLYVAALGPIANSLWRFLEKQAPPATEGPHDAVVLLGGMVDHGATDAHGMRSYNDNVERLLVTYDLLRKTPELMVVIAGGRMYDGAPVVEARTLADQLADWGISRERMLLDEESKNTRQNALNVAKLVRERGFERLVVVTSAFHMARALDCFRKVGLRVDALPVDYRSGAPGAPNEFLPRARAFYETEAALRELFGRVIYRILGYGSGSLEQPDG